MQLFSGQSSSEELIERILNYDLTGGSGGASRYFYHQAKLGGGLSLQTQHI